jgi:hypothetical protein
MENTKTQIKYIPIKFIKKAKAGLEELLPESRVLIMEDISESFWGYKDWLVGKNSEEIVIAPKKDYPQYFI